MLTADSKGERWEFVEWKLAARIEVSSSRPMTMSCGGNLAERRAVSMPRWQEADGWSVLAQLKV